MLWTDTYLVEPELIVVRPAPVVPPFQEGTAAASKHEGHRCCLKLEEKEKKDGRVVVVVDARCRLDPARLLPLRKLAVLQQTLDCSCVEGDDREINISEHRIAREIHAAALSLC